MSKEETSDFGLISKDEKIISRCEEVCREFEFSLKHWPDLDSFIEGGGEYRLVLATNDSEDKNAIAEFAQVVRQVNPHAFFICGVSNLVKPEAAAFAKKSGTDIILLKDEILFSSKLEFICTQMIRARYLPVKVSDLVPGIPLKFDIFHLIPERKKFLSLAFKGDPISQEKITKAAKIGEMYIHRQDAEAFSQYVKETADMSAGGIEKRCRSQFLALCSSSTKLIFLLSDRGEHASFKEGETLLNDCRKLASELLGTLGATQDAFKIVNNSTIGDFGSVERSPAVAAYAGLFALSIGVENVDDTILAALVTDLALLTMTPEVSRKIRRDDFANFTPEERVAYEKYPTLSLELALSRKLALGEKVRTIIVSTQERVDGTGFPNKLPSNKIKEEAQLIHFSREFDRRTTLRLGMTRVHPKQVLQEFITTEFKNSNRFSVALLKKLAKLYDVPI